MKLFRKRIGFVLAIVIAMFLLVFTIYNVVSNMPMSPDISKGTIEQIDEWQVRAKPFMEMFEYVQYSDHVEIEAFRDPAMDNWSEYINSQGKYALTELVVPAYYEGLPVTVIRDGAFGEYYYNQSLRARGECLIKIELPWTVTEIGNYAFKYNRRLVDIEFSDNVQEIGEGAFYECNSLRKLDIPDGITEIKKNTFYLCHSLEELGIPDSVTSIRAHAFYGTIELKNVALPANLTYIDDFQSIPTGFIQSLENPNCGDFYCVGKNNSIALKCFSLKKDVTIPTGIETVVMWFENNDIVETITVPGSVKRVVNLIDGKPNLRKIVFEEGVEELGSCWFNAVPNLTEVYFPESIKSSVMSVWETRSSRLDGSQFNDQLIFYVKEGSYMDEYFKKNDYASRGALIVYY